MLNLKDIYESVELELDYTYLVALEKSNFVRNTDKTLIGTRLCTNEDYDNLMGKIDRKVQDLGEKTKKMLDNLKKFDVGSEEWKKRKKEIDGNIRIVQSIREKQNRMKAVAKNPEQFDSKSDLTRSNYQNRKKFEWRKDDKLWVEDRKRAIKDLYNSTYNNKKY